MPACKGVGAVRRGLTAQDLEVGEAQVEALVATLSEEHRRSLVVWWAVEIPNFAFTKGWMKDPGPDSQQALGIVAVHYHPRFVC